MSGDTRTPVLTPADYDAIEAAVMETARGRWFLTEYARRNRHSDTTTLLRALDRIEQAMTRDRPGHDTTRLRRELLDMSDVIARARRDVATSVAEVAGGAPASPDRAFDDMLEAADRADTDVFNAAERVQEAVWSLRDGRADAETLDELNRQALEIYRASNHHALTTNRARSLVSVLRLLESRIAAIVGSWSDTIAMVDTSISPSVEKRRESVLDTAPPRIRDDIAFVDKKDITPRRAVPAAEPVAVRAPAQQRPAQDVEASDPRAASFAAFEALSADEKLALFA
jgi:hypothetical protein